MHYIKSIIWSVLAGLNVSELYCTTYDAHALLSNLLALLVCYCFLDGHLCFWSVGMQYTPLLHCLVDLAVHCALYTSYDNISSHRVHRTILCSSQFLCFTWGEHQCTWIHCIFIVLFLYRRIRCVFNFKKLFHAQSYFFHPLLWEGMVRNGGRGRGGVG